MLIKTVYVHPSSLDDTLKRAYIVASRTLGVRFRLRYFGERDGYHRCVLEAIAEKKLLKALKKLGIRLCRRPILALLSNKALASILDIPKEPIPIGVGEHGEIIYGDCSMLVGVDDQRLALALCDRPVLWLDFAGDDLPRMFGYSEICGLRMPSEGTILWRMAEALSNMLNVKPREIVEAVSGRSILSDVELGVGDPLSDLRRWWVLVEKQEYYEKNYVDFSGLPGHIQRAAILVASTLWEHWLVIHIPRSWRWVGEALKSRRRTIVVCPHPRGLPAHTIVEISRNMITRRIIFRGRLLEYERPFRPIWCL